MDTLPVTERCLFCDWTWDGVVSEGRSEAIAHRLDAHPEVKPARRMRRGSHLRSFRQPKLKQVDLDEIYGERDKRARLLGIEITSE